MTHNCWEHLDIVFIHGKIFLTHIRKSDFTQRIQWQNRMSHDWKEINSWLNSDNFWRPYLMVTKPSCYRLRPLFQILTVIFSQESKIIYNEMQVVIDYS